MKKILRVFKDKSKSSKSSTSSTPAASSTAPSSTTTPATQSTSTTAPAASSTPNTKMPAPVSTAEYLKAISYRRTVYPLSDKIDVSDDRIVELVQEILKISPSSYNNQHMRVAIFLGSEHKKWWKIISDAALPLLQGAGEETVKAMTQRFEMFSAAYGSITFWDDEETIKASQDTHKSAAGMFPQWADHASGMLQNYVWTAVELEGLGANLQHMNMFPPAEEALKKEFSIPSSWHLKANLNIGGETTPHPEVPEKKPFSETIKVFKS